MSPVGHAHGSGWSPSMQAFPPLGSHPPVFSSGEHDRGNRKTHILAQPVAEQTDRVIRDSPIEMGGSLPSLFTPVSIAHRSGRGMWPAGWNGRSPKKLSDYIVTENSMVSGGKTSAVEKLDSFSDGLVVKRNVGDAPLPGDDVNSHPACVPSLGAAKNNRQEGYRNSVPPRDVTEEAFGLNDTAVLTPAVAGAASSAVTEDLSLADDVGGLPSAVRVSEPLRAAAGADPLIDVEVTSSVDLRGPAGPSGVHASRGSDEDGSLFDIVIEPENQ